VEQSKIDAYFVAHAREDIPALIAEVRRLRVGSTATVGGGVRTAEAPLPECGQTAVAERDDR
jgi:hypothetical protein